MNSALVFLTRLRMRAAWRKVRRTLSRPKGILLVAFSLGFFSLVLLPNLLLTQHDMPPIARVWFLNPPALFAFWLLITLSGRNTAAIAFSLPEVEFLFPGPFTRRQLLVYKLTISSLGALGSAIVFPIFLWRFALWWPAVVLGIWLVFVFIQLTSLLFTLLVDWLGQRYARWPAVLGVVAVIAAGVSAWQGGALEPGLEPLERLAAMESSWVVRGVLTPFAAFSHLARATTLEQLALWGGAAIVTNLAFVALILRMDANFLQATLAASQKRYDWLQRAKRGGGLPAMGTRSKPRLSLPRFPRLAGAGPVAWRQSLELLRTSSRLIFVLPAVLAMSAPAMFAGQQGTTAAVVGMTVMLSYLISTIMPLGMRTDLQHVEALKSLPIPPAAVVWGSIAAAVLYPTLVQAVAIAVLAGLLGHWTIVMTLTLAFALPLNLLLVASDSVLVLLYPSTRRFVPGDFLLGMRLMLSYLAKVLFVLLAAGIAGVYILAVYLLLGEAPVPMAIGSWVVLMFEGALTVWCAALLFDRFDVSLDTADEQ